MPARPRRRSSPSDALRKLVRESLEEDKAEDIVELDVAGRTSVADWMVVCSGRSTRQVSAIADKLASRLKDSGHKGVRVEGKTQGDWVLVDAGDVIVHVFRPEIRDMYQLERLWTFPEEPAEGAPKRRRIAKAATAGDETPETAGATPAATAGKA